MATLGEAVGIITEMVSIDISTPEEDERRMKTIRYDRALLKNGRTSRKDGNNGRVILTTKKLNGLVTRAAT